MNLTKFLTTIGYLLNTKTCPPLKNIGGYPKCSNYHEKDFDFIIVGAGPAGCVLANRLSKNPDVNVLLVEAGPYPSDLSEIPAEYLFLLRSQFDYNFTLQQPDMFQAYKDGVGRIFQGHALGGGSAMNGMIYAPGVPHDYNKWSSQIKNPEWTYDNLKPYFDKVAEMVQTTQYTAMRIPRLNLALAARQLGYTVNNPNDIFGYHDMPIMAHEKTRNSIARAYLKPVANRPNLCVVVGKRVNKVRISPFVNIATGVEIQEEGAPVFVPAKKEVIISAGAINSPKILLLSGIGPRKHLTKLGINVHKDLPVGLLRDHIYAPIYIKTQTLLGLCNHDLYLQAYCKLGLLMNDIDITNFIGLFNTKDEKTHPNIEMFHVEVPWLDKVFLPQFTDGFGYTDKVVQELLRANKLSGVLGLGVVHLHPKSQGEVLLKSTDPNEHPIISANYLNDPDDTKVLIDAIINIVVPIYNTLPFTLSKLIKFDLPQCDTIPISGKYYKSREYWACYLKHFVTSFYHPIATCRMGTESTKSVVDTHFRVWGIHKLRVVDSSAMPLTISGHPTVPVTMMAEKAADIIITDNGLK